MTDDSSTQLTQRIAQRVRELRAAKACRSTRWPARCGVSRSMISLIERGESSPTAVVLEKLAVGLGVSLASLFEAPVPSPEPVSRRDDQPQWRDPASGYLRRNVSPSGYASPIQIVEVSFPPGARVAYETGARDRGCTSRCGCSKAHRGHAGRCSATGSTPATAWRCSSTAR